MNKSLYFDFYGISVRFSTESESLRQRISKDFEYFSLGESEVKKEAHISVFSHLEVIPWEKLPSGPPLWSRKGVKTIDHQGLRYNNYDDKLLSIYSFKKELARIYSEDIHYLHEITYLLILSRVGKALDLKGFHRIHAFGVQSPYKLLLGIFPMGHGKSTSLLEILKFNPQWKWISDDCPLIDSKGLVYSFPLRLGLCSSKIDEWGLRESVYELNRRQWGKKQLVPITRFPRQVASSPSSLPVTLLVGRRKGGVRAKLHPCRKIIVLRELLISMVVGAGLPIIFEYFWETGVHDFLAKSKIALRRLVSAWRLFLRADSYWIDLSDDPEENIRLMEKLIS